MLTLMLARATATVTIATLALAGCAAGTSTAGPSTAPGTQPSATSAPRPAHRRHPPHRKSRRHTTAPNRAAPRPRYPGSRRLPISTASNTVVQRQPAPGSCHQTGSGLYSRPDRACTPGALNPQVTPATIGATICSSGWTETVRPPVSITEQEKVASLAAYGDTGPLSAYEYDHFVPLELGGATNDPRNLWPEPGGSPNPKDSVENELRREVCDGQMTLAAAQHAIVTNWVALARRMPALVSAQSTHSRTAPPSTTTPPTSAHCAVTASYNPRYHDYDVYVHSSRPDQPVTVTDAAGRSRSWHTDGAGTADVYFDAPASAAGELITARVGAATCSGAL